MLAAVPLLSALPVLLFPVLQAPVQVFLPAFLLQQAVLLPLAFLLPQVLREFAGLEKEVVMVGVANRVEIWSKERWQECIDSYDDDMDEVAENMESLGFSI